ncbi:hypothetical protein PIB30_115479, partial [Stylosanthes scabra]|nr:hypothetical protein [Stylosanthes scabra]
QIRDFFSSMSWMSFEMKHIIVSRSTKKGLRNGMIRRFSSEFLNQDSKFFCSIQDC